MKSALIYYLPLVNEGGKPEDAVSVLKQMLATDPSLINFPRLGIGMVQNLLLQPAHEDEALGYAKLYWQTCGFDGNVSDATASLQKAWLAKDLNVVNISNFLKAQQDASAPNPLSQITAPTLYAKAMHSALETYSHPVSTAFLYTHNYITLLLLQGKYGDAMLTARRKLLDDPNNAGAAAQEIARIFKAADLNLTRANAFLEYFKTNKGDNPMSDFFKKYPVGSAAATPAPTKAP